MRKASVHRGAGLSEEHAATTLPHADPRYASESTADTRTCRYAQMQIQDLSLCSDCPQKQWW